MNGWNLDAMQEEMNTLKKSRTWELLSRIDGQNLIGYRWIYKAKYNSDITINWYKARFVLKGCAQTYGLDYEEIFSPIAKCLV